MSAETIVHRCLARRAPGAARGHLGAFGRALGIGVVLAMGATACGSTAARQPATTALTTVVLSRSSLARQLSADFAHGRDMAIERHFDPAMQSGLPASQLPGLWAQLTAKEGSFQGLGAAQEKAVSGGVVVVVGMSFSHGRVGLEWSFDSTGAVNGLHLVGPPASSAPSSWSAPAYDHAGSFVSRPVQLGRGVLQVPGTLDMPKGAGPFPGVVLVAGSGPANENEQIGGGPEEPFRDLAVGLASQGIAVLRYDKPTYAHPAAMKAHYGASITAKVTDIADAEAAARLLMATPGVDAHRVVLAGHSLGAALAPRIAAHVAGLAGLVLLAAPARPLQDYLVPQTRYLLSLQGPLTAAGKAQLQRLRSEVAQVDSPTLSSATPSSRLPFGLPASYWLYIRDYRGPQAAAALHLPMLILQGGSDYQVPPSDLASWKAALASHSNVTVRLLAKLDHLFVHVNGPSTPAGYMAPGHVAASVITDIATWVKNLPGR
ncbi:MAG: alpha/beta hydrolase family protein [Acidimicrobiales bacterium]